MTTNSETKKVSAERHKEAVKAVARRWRRAKSKVRLARHYS